VFTHEVSPEKGWWKVTLFAILTRKGGFGMYWVSVVELFVKD
jgi:hypothetical protein